MQSLLHAEFKAIVFDMDNTLFDFYVCMEAGCRAAIDALGVGTPEELYAYYFRGKYSIEDNQNLLDYMQDHDCLSIDTLKTVRVFDDAKYRVLHPYPGIPEVLSTLKAEGYLLGLVTDAYIASANTRLEKTNLAHYFDAIVGFDTTGYKKPHHAPFECVLDMLNCRPHEAMYIGDSLRRDIGPAEGVGMTAVHARYGFTGEYIFTPKLSVDSPSEILELLHGH
ncbi:MAG TPA: HAD family hydrolase [Methanocorpusculum sp.]|nr:HAD family hydrolase [Methanocorpusculum sp.]